MQLELDFEQAEDLLDLIQSTLEGTDGNHSISHDLVNLYAVRTKLSNLLAIHAINSYGSADADSSNEPPIQLAMLFAVMMVLYQLPIYALLMMIYRLSMIWILRKGQGNLLVQPFMKW